MLALQIILLLVSGIGFVASIVFISKMFGFTGERLLDIKNHLIEEIESKLDEAGKKEFKAMRKYFYIKVATFTSLGVVAFGAFIVTMAKIHSLIMSGVNPIASTLAVDIVSMSVFLGICLLALMVFDVSKPIFKKMLVKELDKMEKKFFVN